MSLYISLPLRELQIIKVLKIPFELPETQTQSRRHDISYSIEEYTDRLSLMDICNESSFNTTRILRSCDRAS